MKRQIKLDHFVIGAESLERGVEYVKDTLGVDMPFGGEHEKMATHNHLMQLGDEIFLEVIAANRNEVPPDRPRWYGLDDPYIRSCLEKQPALLAWVINTDDLEALAQAASFSLGNTELISRGNLSWLFGLPEDGRLLAGGMLPYAIEWHTDSHPSNGMADLGCRLAALEIFHPNASWLTSALGSIDALELVQVNQIAPNECPFLSVDLETPRGKVKLQSTKVSNLKQ